VWSAGCATGEEPFTLAMMCAEEGNLDKVDIVATDVSSKALARARAGKLSARALRASNSTLFLQMLTDRFVKDGSMSTTITSRIDFRRESLMEGAPAERSNLDLIMCRNVLIYFRDDVVRTVVHALAERLRPGGRLLVGASESLLRFGTFLHCEERSGAFFYVRS
jgi:chemotaxis protein methyltransferase CheR